MIDQVISRNFVLDEIRRCRAELQKPLDDRAANDPLNSLSDAEYAGLREDLRKAFTTGSEGQGGLYEGFDRGGARLDEMPLDDQSFFSSDPIISIAQSAIEQALEKENARRIATGRPPLLEPSQDPAVAGGDGGDDDSGAGRGGAGGIIATSGSRIAGLGERRAVAAGGGDLERAFDAFTQTDPRWISSLIAQGIARFREPYKFPEAPATPLVLRDEARLILVGDWGSGLPRAVRLGGIMKGWAEAGRNEGRDTHVVHLGDVYYSGWAQEYEKRFLPPWPVAGAGGGIGSWSLNGNHDMYAGGHGYFGTLLGDARFQRQEKSSWFSFSHKHWEILGLDTAYQEHDLAGGQAAWVAERAAATRKENRKAMLLSHHQLFSAHEKGGPLLREKLADVLAAGLIHSWFWGHEHRCVLYKEQEGIRHARCIGHGGVPVYQWQNENDALPAGVEYEFRGAFRKHPLSPERWAKFGFAVLDLHADGTTRVVYVDEDGEKHHREELV